MSEQKVETNEQKIEPNPEPTEAEVTAREIGWRPVEEWEGDTARHLSADEFLSRNERTKQRGDNILKAANAQQARQLSEMQTTLDDLVKHTKKADSRARQKALDEIKAEQREAVEEGDTQRFDAAAQKMDALAKDVAEEPVTQQHPDADPHFIAFAAENDWYGPDGDSEMTHHANNVVAPNKSTKYQGAAFYEEVAREVRRKYPDYFKGASNTNRNKASAVEGTGNGKIPSKTQWDEVPKEHQPAFYRFVKQGLYENTKEGKEAYADVYLNG